jgi:integrase
LIPCKKEVYTLKDFAEGFFDRNSIYVRRQESRDSMTESYLDSSTYLVNFHILPFFGNAELGEITEEAINDWLLGFKDRVRESKRGETKIGYKNGYANNALSVFNIMLMEAVRRKLLVSNPCASVKKLKNDYRTVDILTTDEVNMLFPKNPLPIWSGKEIVYIANRLASLTGMRIGEIVGLRGEFIFDNYIRVCGQFGLYGYVDHTKTKKDRNIPLIPEMIGLLQKLMKNNGNGFVFSEDGGETPVGQEVMRKEFKRALKRIGLTDAEIKKRGLSPHSWRHFANTEMQIQGLSIPQVQSVTGHSSRRMTEHYSHIDARQINGITKVQAAILGKKKKSAKPENTGKPKKATASKKTKAIQKPVRSAARTAKVLKFTKKPEVDKTPKRKQA